MPKKIFIIIAFICIALQGAATIAQTADVALAQLSQWQPPYHASLVHPIASLTCKQMSSCEEAVALWCNGYSRADADDDGIPCETVCHSLDDVERIKAEVGC